MTILQKSAGPVAGGSGAARRQGWLPGPHATTESGARPPAWGVVVLCGAVAAAVAAATTVIAVTFPGLVASGPMMERSVSAARGLGDLAAAGTVGALVLRALLAPGARLPSTTVRWWAASWLVVVCAQSVLAAALIAGTTPAGLLGLGVHLSAYLTIPSLQGHLTTAVLLAVLVVVASGRPGTPAWRGMLALAVLAPVPTLVTGHAGHSTAGGTLDRVALAGHVLPALVWVGGLVAVTTLARRPDLLVLVVPRFSRLAAICWSLTLVLGVAVALGRMSFEDLGTPYGRLVMMKLVAMSVLTGIGVWHRTCTVPAASAGRPRALLRLALVELVVMAAAVGAAASLAGTAPPG